MNAPRPLDFLARAPKWLGVEAARIDRHARRVIERAAQRRSIAEDPNGRIDAQATFGERLADRVATFGGSWTFILIFCAALGTWSVLNSAILGPAAFDPYPYIFLNLMLSMVAALQAPIIMMSQNRQAKKDREMATYTYEVGLKAELEIMALHEKIDALHAGELHGIIEEQKRQLDLLNEMARHLGLRPGAA